MHYTLPIPAGDCTSNRQVCQRRNPWCFHFWCFRPRLLKRCVLLAWHSCDVKCDQGPWSSWQSAAQCKDTTRLLPSYLWLCVQVIWNATKNLGCATAKCSKLNFQLWVVRTVLYCTILYWCQC